MMMIKENKRKRKKSERKRWERNEGILPDGWSRAPVHPRNIRRPKTESPSIHEKSEDQKRVKIERWVRRGTNLAGARAGESLEIGGRLGFGGGDRTVRRGREGGEVFVALARSRSRRGRGGYREKTPWMAEGHVVISQEAGVGEGKALENGLGGQGLCWLRHSDDTGPTFSFRSI